jgi:hypothetical protein
MDLIIVEWDFASACLVGGYGPRIGKEVATLINFWFGCPCPDISLKGTITYFPSI